MNAGTFQERYCLKWSVSPERYREDLLRRSLYPHARPFVAVLRWIDRHYFQPDLEFIADVGLLRGTATYWETVEYYALNHANRRMLRDALRLRVSARRMWRIVKEVMPEGRARTGPAFDAGGSSLAPFAPRTTSAEDAWPKRCRLGRR